MTRPALFCCLLALAPPTSAAPPRAESAAQPATRAPSGLIQKFTGSPAGLPSSSELSQAPPPLSAPAEPEPLTGDAALRRAWRDNPKLLAAQDRVHQAEWAYEASGSHPSANFALGSFQGLGSANANGNYLSEDRGDYYVSVNQPFLPLGALDTRRKSAYRDLTQARAAYAQSRIELTQQVQDAFDSVLAGQATVAVAQRNMELADHILTLTTRRMEIGSGARVDQLNATIQRNRTSQELTLSQTELAQARAELSGLLGLTLDRPVEGTLETPDAPLVLNTLLALAETHPRLLQAQESLEQSHADRILSEQQTNPTPAVSFAYDLVRPTYVFGLSLSIPLDWGAIRNDVKQKRAVETEREHLLLNERRTLTTELQSAYQAYQGALQNARNYTEQVLQPAEELTRITEFGYKQSAVPYLQYLTVEQQLITIRKEQVDRQLTVRRALHKLEAAVGQQLTPPPPTLPTTP